MLVGNMSPLRSISTVWSRMHIHTKRDIGTRTDICHYLWASLGIQIVTSVETASLHIYTYYKPEQVKEIARQIGR